MRDSSCRSMLTPSWTPCRAGGLCRSHSPHVRRDTVDRSHAARACLLDEPEVRELLLVRGGGGQSLQGAETFRARRSAGRPKGFHPAPHGSVGHGVHVVARFAGPRSGARVRRSAGRREERSRAPQAEVPEYFLHHDPLVNHRNDARRILALRGDQWLGVPDRRVLMDWLRERGVNAQWRLASDTDTLPYGRTRTSPTRD